MDSPFKINIPSGKLVILFDGHCNLCNGLVNFLIDKDDKNIFLFESLQSDLGIKIQQHFQLKHIDSIVVLTDKNLVYYRSKAVLFIASQLGGWFNLFLFLKIIPSFISDFFYKIIAYYRYRWFGRKDICRIPTEDTKLRFLETYQNS
jgi:predicted DCC family thiol-disulfide oxidoreductase YuxK